MSFREKHNDLKNYFKTLGDTPLPHDISSYGYWVRFQEHGILPYSGAWLDQPQWVIDDFRYFDLLEEYHNLPYWINQAVKNIKDIAERGHNGR